MNPQKLLEEIRNGNEKVLLRFYSENRNSFIAYAYKKYGLDHEILKEIYQDAVLAFRNNIVEGRLTQFTCKPKTYLFEIGIHLIGKEIRKKQHEVRMPEHLENTYQDKDADLFSKMEMNENEELIRQELKRIGEKCFKLLYAFYYEKKSMETIAFELNYTNVDSAKSSKYNCFQKLKEAVLKNFSRINLQTN